jgi:hypothetical protein
MGSDHKDMVNKFNQLNGADFDKQFIDHMVQSHQKSVDLFDRQARQGEDAQVRAFAARTLPTLRQHLQMAKDLQTQLNGSDLGTPRRTPGSNNPSTTPGTNPGTSPSGPIQPLGPNNPNNPTQPFDPNNPNQPAQTTTGVANRNWSQFESCWPNTM